MYDENSMKSHIFWIKVRRVFLLIFLTAIGTGLGIIISDYIVNILLFSSILRPIIIISSAVIFLLMALLLTSQTGKEIEDGYWKIAVYKKLAIISKKLDALEKVDNSESLKSENISKKIESKQPEKITEKTSEKENIDPQVTTENVIVEKANSANSIETSATPELSKEADSNN